MDDGGIDMQVLTRLIPMVQEGPDTGLAARLNTHLRMRVIDAHPDRFAGFATLPMSDPDAAAVELTRAVTELGLAGAAVFGTVGGRFLDHPDLDPVLETAARLDVPIYVQHETALHILRLITAGTFDRHPTLKIILGQPGVGLPFHLGDLGDALAAVLDGPATLATPDYFRRNVWVAVPAGSGDGSLRVTRQAFGDDRLLLSVGCPRAGNPRAEGWLAGLDVGEPARTLIAHGTAETVLHLPIA
jgi:predicted TIM-barrel fold metal-dependent hydrolase